MRAAIQARGAELRYLPPYSPDLNLIEQVCAKLKRLLRAAARTKAALWTAIGRLLDRFSADECLRYIRHVHYAGTGLPLDPDWASV